jgi:hypothetical protein
LIGATSEGSSHRLPSVKSASGRAVSASANDHRLLTQTCDASPYRGMLRVGVRCSNWGTPAGGTNLLLRFGPGQPVLPCTRSTPCNPPWQGPPCVGSRTRLATSFALFGALMAGTRLRGDHTCRRVVPGWLWEEGVVIGGLRRAGALRRAGFRGHWESVAVSCDRDTDPSHIGCVIRQAPTARQAITGRNDRPWSGTWSSRTGVGAPSRDGYRRAPLPGSPRAAGRVGVNTPPPGRRVPGVMHGARRPSPTRQASIHGWRRTPARGA